MHTPMVCSPAASAWAPRGYTTVIISRGEICIPCCYICVTYNYHQNLVRRMPAEQFAAGRVFASDRWTISWTRRAARRSPSAKRSHAHTALRSGGDRTAACAAPHGAPPAPSSSGRPSSQAAPAVWHTHGGPSSWRASGTGGRITRTAHARRSGRTGVLPAIPSAHCPQLHGAARQRTAYAH